MTLFIKIPTCQTERTKGNGKFKFKKIKPGKYTLNIYGSGGNSATKEIDLRSKSVTKLEVLPSQDDKQPQLTVESEVGNVVLKWEPIKDASEYIIFRDNTELKKIKNPPTKIKCKVENLMLTMLLLLIMVDKRYSFFN